MIDVLKLHSKPGLTVYIDIKYLFTTGENETFQRSSNCVLWWIRYSLTIPNQKYYVITQFFSKYYFITGS